MGSFLFQFYFFFHHFHFPLSISSLFPPPLVPFPRFHFSCVLRFFFLLMSRLVDKDLFVFGVYTSLLGILLVWFLTLRALLV